MRSDETTWCVVFINPWDKRIGPNRYLVDLLRQDSQLAANSYVVLPEDGEAAQEFREVGCQVEIWDNARLVHVGLSLKNIFSVLKRHTVGVIHPVRRLRDIKPSVVVTNSENVWMGSIASKLLAIPHFQVFHALSLENNWRTHPWLVRFYLRFLSTWNVRMIAVSDAVCQMLIRNGIPSQRVVLVPNGMSIAAIESASRAPVPIEIHRLIAGHYPVVVSLGRISATKGQDLLVGALPYVREKYPNFICLFAGQVLSNEGLEDTQSFHASLRELVHELSLDDHVRFLGEIDFVPALLSRADIYVQPSRSESFCRAVAEAIICGVPVAAFAVGGIPEIVGAQSDGLVPPGQVRSLGEAITRLVADPELGGGVVSAAQSNIRREFDVRLTVDRFRRALGIEASHAMGCSEIKGYDV